MKNLLSIPIIFFLILLSGCASSESTASQSSFEYPEGCEEPRKPPKILNMKEVMDNYHEYPADLRSREIEGRVVLDIHVSETGSIEGMDEVRSPHFRLTEVSQNAVKYLRVEPGLCSGIPTPMRFNFALSYYVNSSF